MGLGMKRDGFRGISGRQFYRITFGGGENGCSEGEVFAAGHVRLGNTGE